MFKEENVVDVMLFMHHVPRNELLNMKLGEYFVGYYLELYIKLKWR